MRYSIFGLVAAAISLFGLAATDAQHPVQADEGLMLAQARGGGRGRGARAWRSGGFHGAYHPYAGRYPYWPHGYPYVYPYPSYSSYYWDYYWYPPPLYIPAETIYGPEVMKRFMGISPMTPVPRAFRAPVDEPDADPPAEPDKKEPKIRKIHPAAIAPAWRLIGLGDGHFGEQNYAQALARYREAVRTAPDLAEAHFRQGFAYIAQGRYELAAEALKQGLKLRPDWPASGFSSKELYGEANLAKEAHLDALAEAAEDNPNDADLLFLVGVYLYFDGRIQRAAPFFLRAAELSDDDAHIQPFLRQLALGRPR